MADLLSHQVFARGGVNSDPTLRTGTPGAYIDVPIDSDGYKLEGSYEAQELATEHKDKGARYILIVSKNAAEGSLTTNVHPEFASLILGAAITETADGLPQYMTWQQWWTDGIIASSGGRQAAGVLAKSLALSWDRGQPAPLKAQLGCFINEDSELADGDQPTPTWPTQDPYVGINAYIDLEIADSGGAFTAWTGDNSDIKRMAITFDNGVTVDLFRPNATVDLDLTWTKAIAGIPSLTANFTLFMTSGTYMDLHRISGIRLVRFRIMGVGSSPSYSSTITDPVTAGSNKTVNVAATTGVAQNDYVLLNDGTKQCVAKVTAVVPATSVTLDEVDCNIGDNATIKNTAYEIKVPTAKVVAAPSLGNDGNAKAVTIQAKATLEATQSSIVTLKAYNDDAT